MSKKLFYTVITGDYDRVKKCPNVKGYDHLLITDNPNIDPNGWTVKLIEPSDNPAKLNRYWKINSHLFEGYDMTVYVDGSFQFANITMENLINKYHRGDVTIMSHPTRKCVVAECEQIIALGKDKPEIVRDQLAKYIGEGMPFNYGLYSAGFMIRNRVPKVAEFEKIWWNEVENHSHRDQMSVSYAKWKSGIKIGTIDYNVCLRYFTIVKHEPPKRFNIWYSNPYSIDKNFGGAINAFCAIVPNDEDWIVIQDGDMNYLRPDWGKIVYDTLKLCPSEFGLLGCYTNRLKGTHQLYLGKFSEDHNVLNHYKISTLEEFNTTKIVETSGVAGVFMAFKKKTWKKVGGFIENSHTFDTDFNHRIKAVGLKVGLMKGLYVYHFYRGWSTNPKGYDTHLLK